MSSGYETTIFIPDSIGLERVVDLSRALRKQFDGQCVAVSSPRRVRRKVPVQTGAGSPEPAAQESAAPEVSVVRTSGAGDSMPEIPAHLDRRTRDALPT